MVSIAIVAHPKRAHLVKNLVEVLSEYKEPTVIPSENKPCRSATREAFEAYDKKEKHHLVLHDDAILGRDFTKNLVGCIRANKSNCLSLFYSKSTALKAINYSRWLITDAPWGLGIVMPTNDIDEMLTWQDEYLNESYTIADDPIGAFYTLEKEKHIWVPLPTLLQHDSFKNPSLLKHGALAGSKVFIDDFWLGTTWDIGIKTPYYDLHPKWYMSKLQYRMFNERAIKHYHLER